VNCLVERSVEIPCPSKPTLVAAHESKARIQQDGPAFALCAGDSVDSVRGDQIRKGKDLPEDAQCDIWGLNPGSAAKLTAFAHVAISTSNVHTFVSTDMRLPIPWGETEVGVTRTMDSQRL
jgi:hypothetical protein